MNSLPEPFPNIGKGHNPAIRLFGSRFFIDQTVMELLTEFLILVFSEKWIGYERKIITPMPSYLELQEWSVRPQDELYYKPPVKLNLKLFAFLSCSKVETRHVIHEKHYKYLVEKLAKRVRMNSGDTDSAIDWIEELFRSFQGAGFNRAWCAQTFYPISTSLLTQETIWNETISKREPLNSWADCIEGFNKYYSVSKHRFMARGGELLYLQLCNVFITNQDLIKDLAGMMGFSEEESDLKKLHESLQEGLHKLNSQYTQSFDKLVDFIESLDEETHAKTNSEKNRLSCEWCPRETWRESFLFAVEIKRLLDAVLDPVERLELMMTGCALQVLRSISAQSIRYGGDQSDKVHDNAPGYAWIFSSPDTSSRQQRLASHANLQVMQGVIQKALRHQALRENTRKSKDKSEEQLYSEADRKYGHKLFLSLGKRLGILVPRTGTGTRFIMTDSLLRYLVLVLLSPGDRCTYDQFMEKLYRHFGIAIEGKELTDALKWSGMPVNSNLYSSKESWLAEMLRAGGFLTELSDACSIVCNTFGNKRIYRG